MRWKGQRESDNVEDRRGQSSQRSGGLPYDSFTHGTSEQRYHWFKRGFDQGSIAACDTFGVNEL